MVSASRPQEPRRVNKHSRSNEGRRNLYVLGLPFDLNKYVCIHLSEHVFTLPFARAEFMEIFSRYGAVSHAVILATVDNSSRRRGFIVMGSHQEAKAAMDGLSRREIK